MNDVEIRIESIPTPHWWLGEVAGEPMLFLSLAVHIRNAGRKPLDLVSAFLEGAEGLALPSSLFVPAGGEMTATSTARVWPVVGLQDEKLTRRVWFMDSTGRRHDAGVATFEPRLFYRPPAEERRYIPNYYQE